MHFYFLFIIAFSLNFGFSAEKESHYYYCHSYPDRRMSAFDRMIEISVTPSGNTLNTYMRSDKPLLKTYNKPNKIISVYKDRFLSRHKSNTSQFIILEMDLSQKTFTKYLAYHNMSVKDFEYAYQIPFSNQTLLKYNRNPEVLKYLSVKPVEKGNFSYAYAGQPMPCRPLSYMGYLKDTFLLALIQILSAG